MTQFSKSSLRISLRRLSLLVLSVVAACSGSGTSPSRMVATGGAAGSSAGGSGAGPVCATGQVQCATGCADLSSDEANCGNCGTQCSAGTSCVNGSCQCQTGLTQCSGTCVDTRASAANCGGCGTACAAGSVCSLGQCQTSCATGLTQCGTDCVDLTTNVAHCGNCTQACASGQTCTNSACACAAQQKLCGAYCVDVLTDPANCGDCGVSCGANACNAGVCATGTGGTGGTGGTTGGTGGTGGTTGGTGGTTGGTGGTTGGTGGTGGTCTTATYQGEAMTPSATGVGQVQGTYFNLWANGSLSTTADLSGARTITVYAAGTAADASHNPHMVVLVNGTAIGNVTVTPGTTFNAYSFNYTGTGSQTLAIQFDNDFRTASGGDTNLYIDQVVVSCGTGGTGGTGGTTGGTGGTGGTTGGTGGTTGGTGGTTGGTGGTATGGTGTGGTATGGTGTGGTVNCSGTLPSGGTPHTSSNASGTAAGLSWSIWTNSGPGTITTYNTPAFSASWGGSGDFLARLGLEWGNSGKTYKQFGTITAQFAETKSGTAGGYSFVGVYGWSYSPCVEYYIVDDSFNGMPVGLGTGTTNKGTATIDGGTYTLYQRSTTGTGGSRCSGVSSWLQFYSIRSAARTCGTISITQHFDAWAAKNMVLGNMIEAKVLIETGGGNGSISFTTANVTAK